ncbi:3915_t:CDS:2, partial [Ambispora gerdemannii]
IDILEFARVSNEAGRVTNDVQNITQQRTGSLKQFFRANFFEFINDGFHRGIDRNTRRPSFQFHSRNRFQTISGNRHHIRSRL